MLCLAEMFRPRCSKSGVAVGVALDQGGLHGRVLFTMSPGRLSTCTSFVTRLAAHLLEESIDYRKRGIARREHGEREEQQKSLERVQSPTLERVPIVARTATCFFIPLTPNPVVP